MYKPEQADTVASILWAHRNSPLSAEVIEEILGIVAEVFRMNCGEAELSQESDLSNITALLTAYMIIKAEGRSAEPSGER